MQGHRRGQSKGCPAIDGWIQWKCRLKTARTVASEGLLPRKRYDATISGSMMRVSMGGFGRGSVATVCLLGSTKLIR